MVPRRSRHSKKQKFQDYCSDCSGIIDKLIEGYGNRPSWDEPPSDQPFRSTAPPRPPQPQALKRTSPAPRPRPTAAPAPNLSPQVYFLPGPNAPINIKINSNSISNSNRDSNPRPKWKVRDGDLDVRSILLRERNKLGSWS